MAFVQDMETVAKAVEGAAVVILAAGLVAAFVNAARAYLRRTPDLSTCDTLRRGLGRSILLGLEIDAGSFRIGSALG